MDEKEVFKYIEKYASQYRKEQITKRLLESGASYESIVKGFDNFSKISDSTSSNHEIDEDKEISSAHLKSRSIKKSKKQQRKKKSSSASLLILIFGIILFGIILLYPHQTSSIFIKDSIKVSNYFSIDSSSSFEKTGEVKLYLKYLSVLDLEISSSDAKNYLVAESGVCKLENIEKIDDNENQEDIIILEQNFEYVFTYVCMEELSNSYTISGHIALNLFEPEVDEYITLKRGTFRVSNNFLFD